MDGSDEVGVVIEGCALHAQVNAVPKSQGDDHSVPHCRAGHAGTRHLHVEPRGTLGPRHPWTHPHMHACTDIVVVPRQRQREKWAPTTKGQQEKE